VRLGRRVLVEETELERFIESGRAPLGIAEQAAAQEGGNHA